jgi:hypothetical protein
MRTAISVAHLRAPEFWDQVAKAIGDHPYTYDLDDSSHRLDVVQIVCQTVAQVTEQA